MTQEQSRRESASTVDDFFTDKSSAPPPYGHQPLNLNVNLKLFLNQNSSAQSSSSNNSNDAFSDAVPEAPSCVPTSRPKTQKQRRNSYRFVSEVLGGSCTSQDLAADLQAVVNELNCELSIGSQAESSTWSTIKQEVIEPVVDNSQYDPFFVDQIMTPITEGSVSSTPTCANPLDVNLVSPNIEQIAAPTELLGSIKTEDNTPSSSCCFSLKNIKLEPAEPLSVSPQRPNLLQLGQIITPASPINAGHQIRDVVCATSQTTSPISCPTFEDLTMASDEPIPPLVQPNIITPSPSTPQAVPSIITNSASTPIVIGAPMLSPEMTQSTISPVAETKLFDLNHQIQHPEQPVQTSTPSPTPSNLMVFPPTPPGSQPSSPINLQVYPPQQSSPSSSASTFVSTITTPTILTIPSPSLMISRTTTSSGPIPILPAPQPGRQRTGPRPTPHNTHPGCTTIKYNRKNNPDLEKRRIHFCDFPSKFEKYYKQNSDIKG